MPDFRVFIKFCAKTTVPALKPLYTPFLRWYTLSEFMITMGKIRQILALAIVTATLALAGAIALKAYRGMRSSPLLPSLPKNIEVSLKKIHYSETKDGIKKWDLVADKGEYDKGNEVIRLAGVHLDVASAGQSGDITLTADRGDYHTVSKDIRVSGNVVAKSASGMVFTTGQAAYTAARSMIHTADRVRFVDGNLTVEGRGMEFMTESKKVKVLQDVTATVIPGAGKP
jgi:LPS export ABC transporter protein LptC